jgi:2-oxoglutarate dehydrogenase E2 component (dihydrolipoamide succinyltransferase)
MPQMGESVFEGTLTKWLKKVGDAVARDEPLFEIATDKVDSEIPAPASGILSEILVPEGKTIQINTVLATIEEAGAQGAKAEEARAEDSVPQESGVQESGGQKKADSGISSEKDIPDEKIATAAPMPERPPVDKAEESPVSADEEKPKLGKPDGAEESGPQERPPVIRVLDIRTSPLVRRLARENNVDLSEIQGTGLEGRITKQDMLNYLEKRSASKPESAERQDTTAQMQIPESASQREAPEEASAQALPKSPEMPRFVGDSETVALTPMRKAIAEHMVLSKRISAHVNTVFEVDMTAIVKLREANKAEFHNREGIPLTYTPFFAKALVDNVREFPVFNASISGDSIIYKKPINIGIAVALDTGLIVPVIKNAQLKSFTGIALAINDLAARARSKRLKPDDVQDGTVSLTNPGSFGALFSTPVISQPQVAILGIGGIEKRPVVIDDAIAIRSMVCLSLTFDHRLIDGAVADRFMAKLKERLQTWTQWAD